MHPFLRPRLGITGLISAAGAVAAVASIAGFGGRYWWLLELASHFRVQYIIVLSIAAIALGVLRAYWVAAVFAAAALLNVAVVLPLYVGSSRPVGSHATSMRAMLINVHTNNPDHLAVLDSIKTHDPDFVVLEEVNERWVKELEAIGELYQHVVTRPREDNFGIALLSKRAMVDFEILRIGTPDLPSVLARFDVQGNRFVLLGTHALPPVSSEYARVRNAHLAAIPDVLASLDAPVLLLGDLNVSPWSHYFKRLVRDSALQDSSRGRGVQATWPTHMFPLLIPIDHCLHSPEITIINKTIAASVGSDHYPVDVPPDFSPPVMSDSGFLVLSSSRSERLKAV